MNANLINIYSSFVLFRILLDCFQRVVYWLSYIPRYIFRSFSDFARWWHTVTTLGWSSKRRRAARWRRVSVRRKKCPPSTVRRIKVQGRGGGRGPEVDGPPVDRLDWSIDRYISLPLYGASSFVTPACCFFLARNLNAARIARASLVSTLFPFDRTCASRVSVRAYIRLFTPAHVHSTFLSSIFFVLVTRQ